MLRERLRRHLNFTVPARIGTRDYRIPVWGGMETPGAPAPWHVGFYRRVLADRPGTFVDGGMNLGQTLLSVRAVDPHRPFIGFEPNPKCVAYLERLVDVNGMEGVTVVPTGLSDQAGLRRLYFPPDDSANPAATLIKNLRPQSAGHASRVIAVGTYDELAPDVDAGPVGFVKIDVEGHEMEALRGMAGTFSRDRPVALVEVLPRVGGTTPEETAQRRSLLQELVASWGYVIRHVEPLAAAPAEVRIEPFTEFKGLPFDLAVSYDYLFVPEEKAADVESAFSR